MRTADIEVGGFYAYRERRHCPYARVEVLALTTEREVRTSRSHYRTKTVTDGIRVQVVGSLERRGDEVVFTPTTLADPVQVVRAQTLVSPWDSFEASFRATLASELEYRQAAAAAQALRREAADRIPGLAETSVGRQGFSMSGFIEKGSHSFSFEDIELIVAATRAEATRTESEPAG